MARTSRAGTWTSRERPGFTLLEMLLVMVLLALVAGLAAPSVGLVNFEGGLATSARRITGAVHEARVQAARTRSWVELEVVYPRTKRQRRLAGDGPVELVLRERDRDGVYEEFGRAELPKDVKVVDVLVEGLAEDEEQVPVMRFHPRGMTLPAAVRLRSGDNECTLCVRPVSGVVRLDGLVGLEHCKRDERDEDGNDL